MTFKLPTTPGGHDSPPPDGSSKPQRPRGRGKSTNDLLSAYEELQTQGEALAAQLRERKRTLETECYSVLGSTLFSRRVDDQVQAAYQSLTAPFGARMKRKLDELAKLADIDS